MALIHNEAGFNGSVYHYQTIEHEQKTVSCINSRVCESGLWYTIFLVSFFKDIIVIKMAYCLLPPSISNVSHLFSLQPLRSVVSSFTPTIHLGSSQLYRATMKCPCGTWRPEPDNSHCGPVHPLPSLRHRYVNTTTGQSIIFFLWFFFFNVKYFVGGGREGCVLFSSLIFHSSGVKLMMV